jgi:hypothetical protein
VEASFKTTYSSLQEVVRRGLAPTPGYLLQMSDGNVIANVGSYDTKILAVRTTDRYDDGLWHHAVLVTDRDRAKIYLYVDGKLAAPTVDDPEPFSVHDDRCLTIGLWENPDWPYYFRGAIDNVIVLKGAHHPMSSALPCINVVPRSLQFGTVHVGSVSVLPLTILNSSTQEPLAISIHSSDSVFKPSSTTLSLAPGELQVISVRYAPKQAQTDSTFLWLESNDPVHPIVNVLLLGSGTGSGGTKNLGALEVTVNNAEDWGKPGTLARVVLYSSAGVPWQEVRANASSIARFDSVPAGDNYYYRVYVAKATSWGEIFAGEKTGVSLKVDQVTSETFIHNTPYCPTVNVYNDLTNVALPDSGYKPIRAGTRLRVELKMKNPTYAGARTVSGYGMLRFDRDKVEPYDTLMRSSIRSLSPGDTTTLIFYWVPQVAGAYNLTVCACASSDRYATTLTDADNWHDPEFTVLPDTVIPPPWTYANTGTTHTIIIPTTANTGINGSPLDRGDYVGVFFDSSGTLKCAGYERWTGTGNIAVAAFADDPTTSAKDGFATGEVFRWKIFRAISSEVTTVDAVYSSPAGIITHTNTFAPNGISKVVSLTEGNTVRRIPLRAGWGLISSTVAPYVPSLDSIFNAIRSHVIIVKNGEQKSYIPSVPVNTIGFWNITEGYQIKMAEADTLRILGSRIIPQYEALTLPAGWSIMPYLKDTTMAIGSLLGGVSSYVNIVKDQDGKTYIPSAGINTIGNLQPGQGYQLKMASSRTLEYPSSLGSAESAPPLQKSTAGSLASSDAPGWYYANTGESHTIILPLTAAPTAGGSPLSAGGYIGVFYDSSGTLACAGYERWTGNTNIAIAAFGDDPTTPAKDGLAVGEVIKWKIWRSGQSTSYAANATYLAPGSLGGVVTDSSSYRVNGISGLSALTGSLTGVNAEEQPVAFGLEQNYPNPFNPSTLIRFQLPTAAFTKLAVFDLLGREVSVLVDGRLESGSHMVRFDATGLSSGVYFYRLTAGSQVAIRRLTVLK